MNRCSFASRVVSVLMPGALLVLSACKSEPPKPPPPQSVPPPAAKPPPTASKTTTPPSGASAAPAAMAAPVEIVEESTAAAEVVAISAEDRRITLRREDGTTREIVAGEEVRNFDQIAVGDTLRVKQRESMNVALCPPGTEVKAVEGAYGAMRAPKGAKPGAAGGWAASTRVRVESIDPERGIVVFSKASGELAAHKVKTPQGREFVKGLKVGDVVQLDFAKATAISVDKE